MKVKLCNNVEKKMEEEKDSMTNLFKLAAQSAFKEDYVKAVKTVDVNNFEPGSPLKRPHNLV